MGLAVKYHEETAYPALACDSCRKEIEDWKGAIISYEMPAGDETLCSAHVYHKGACDHGVPLRYELSSYLPVLLWNHNWGRKHKFEEANEVITEVCVEVKRALR